MSSGEDSSVRWAWERALLDARVGKRMRTVAVGLTLATYAGRDGGKIYPGQELLASRLECSVGTVKAALRELEGMGFIEKTGPRPNSAGRAQEWRLVIPQGHPAASATDPQGHPAASQQTISLPTFTTGLPVEPRRLGTPSTIGREVREVEEEEEGTCQKPDRPDAANLTPEADAFIANLSPEARAKYLAYKGGAT